MVFLELVVDVVVVGGLVVVVVVVVGLVLVVVVVVFVLAVVVFAFGLVCSSLRVLMSYS